MPATTAARPRRGSTCSKRKGHFPSAIYRGYKSDIWDGGHRIPLIVRWPGKIQPGSHSDQLTCLTDLLATCAEILHDRLPANAGEDSVGILPAWLGTDKGPLREAVVHHSINGRFAIRQGRWKLELCPGSGGWGSPHDKQARAEGLPPMQLYDMTADPAERRNRSQEHPEIVARLTKLLEKYVAEGRSTPGQPQRNDVPVDIWKDGRRHADHPARKRGAGATRFLSQVYEISRVPLFGKRPIDRCFFQTRWRRLPSSATAARPRRMHCRSAHCLTDA